jgi:hypothetical protein
MFVVWRKCLQAKPGPLDECAIRTLEVRMLLDKDSDAQATSLILYDLRNEAIVFIAVRLPELAKNLDTGQEHLRLSFAETKMFVPRMYGRSVAENFDDGKSIEDAFLK